ncbi:MAG: DPP IV N-terminal domain-containing protein, partial [Phycisphaerales bacterium]
MINRNIAIVALGLALGGCGGGQIEESTPSVSTGETAPSLQAAGDFLDAYARTYRFTLGRPKAVKPSPDGKSVFFLRSPGRSFVQDLYEFDLSSGKERVLLTADAILGGGEENLSAEEKARRERMRMTSRGIAAYDLSDDGAKILVPLSGRLFIVNRADMGVKELNPKLRQGFPIDPQFSPDGSMISCVREGDVFVQNIMTGEEIMVTPGASGAVSYGAAEFAAQEEMSRFHGYWWSPDSSAICYQVTDVKDVMTYYIADPVNPHKEPEASPYPKCGTPNASVKLEIAKLDGSSRVRVSWDFDRYPDLANVKWSKNAPLTILVQNREQTEQVLYAVA